MDDVTLPQIVSRLQSVGIVENDGLLVHSAIQFLGRPVGGIQTYLQAIQSVIGPEGTIAVPTFNFSFAENKRYDPQKTPAHGMGVFSEYIRQHPAALRTYHPMQSMAIIGFHAGELAERDTPSAFDSGSAFEYLLELDFKLLLLGADVRAVSIFHYSEQRFNVPYRYWKDFSGLVRTPQGWQERTYRMFVRDLEINPQLTAEPIQRYLVERGLWKSIQLNYGEVCSCKLRDFVEAVDHFLSKDPWSLVVNPPG